jgi:hypothetical protein
MLETISHKIHYYQKLVKNNLYSVVHIFVYRSLGEQFVLLVGFAFGDLPSDQLFLFWKLIFSVWVKLWFYLVIPIRFIMFIFAENRIRTEISCLQDWAGI